MKTDKKPTAKKAAPAKGAAKKKTPAKKAAVKKEAPGKETVETTAVTAPAPVGETPAPKPVEEAPVAETIESGNLGGETTTEECNLALRHYSFVARYDNVKLQNITLDNLKAQIYECDALTLKEALGYFMEALGADPKVQDVKRLLKKTFGATIIVESAVINSVLVETISTDAL